MSLGEISIGCAGWSIPKDLAGRFPRHGSELSRYSRMLPAVEINSSFYRPHRRTTYLRWAQETDERFLFSIKVPKEITHTRRLVDIEEPLEQFVEETSGLEGKRGPLLVQLPPSLSFKVVVADSFFSSLRRMHAGAVVCEPRHVSWFTSDAERLLVAYKVARVAADPVTIPLAERPGGWDGLVYFRLHGSPRMYYSAYAPEYLDALSITLGKAAKGCPVWCIFDNTAAGAAIGDAMETLGRVGKDPQEVTGGFDRRERTE